MASPEKKVFWILPMFLLSNFKRSIFKSNGGQHNTMLTLNPIQKVKNKSSLTIWKCPFTVKVYRPMNCQTQSIKSFLVLTSDSIDLQVFIINWIDPLGFHKQVSWLMKFSVKCMWREKSSFFISSSVRNEREKSWNWNQKNCCPLIR